MGNNTSERRTLRGDRNQCAGCGEFFNSTFAFEKHRAGEHAGNGRRCLTPDQMREKGMDKNAADFWVGNPREDASSNPTVDDQNRFSGAADESIGGQL